LQTSSEDKSQETAADTVAPPQQQEGDATGVQTHETTRRIEVPNTKVQIPRSQDQTRGQRTAVVSSPASSASESHASRCGAIATPRARRSPWLGERERGRSWRAWRRFGPGARAGGPAQKATAHWAARAGTRGPIPGRSVDPRSREAPGDGERLPSGASERARCLLFFFELSPDRIYAAESTGIDS
jgi:hypothetical protein